jgi:hypothetical protein
VLFYDGGAVEKTALKTETAAVSSNHGFLNQTPRSDLNVWSRTIITKPMLFTQIRSPLQGSGVKRDPTNANFQDAGAKLVSAGTQGMSESGRNHL